jgi:hypothetical protein
MTSWWPQKGLFMAKNVTQEHFDASIARLEKRFVSQEHFDASIAGLEDKFISKEYFDQTMNGVGSRFDEVMTKMDGIATILQRLDQERVFTVEWIRRIESDVSRVKHHLKLA